MTTWLIVKSSDKGYVKRMHWQRQGLRAKSEWRLKESGLVTRSIKKTEARKIIKLFPLCSFLMHWRMFFILKSRMPSIEQIFRQWFLGVSVTFPTSFHNPLFLNRISGHISYYTLGCVLVYLPVLILFSSCQISLYFPSLPPNMFVVIYADK